MREKFFSPWKCLVVLEVVSQPQASVETHELEGPFVLADPLPSRMDSLCVQHMIRRQQEPRTQEPEKGLKPSITMPEDHSRISVGEVNQGIPEVLCRKKELFEGGPVCFTVEAKCLARSIAAACASSGSLERSLVAIQGVRIVFSHMSAK